MLRSIDADGQLQREAPAVRSAHLRVLDGSRPRMPASSVHTEDPDGDIIRLINDGDLNAALCRLMRRYGTAVYRYCRRALHDPTLADDVHQLIFIQAHGDFAGFAGLSTLQTWLFTIARHRVYDTVKSRRRELAHIEERSLIETADPISAPGERIDDARLCQALLSCFDELGEQLRTVVLLRYQEGLTFADMAKICAEKPATLRARVMRALQKLRVCIEARTGGQL